MTAEVTNLRKFRKAKARADKQRQAADNRVKFGRSKIERETAAARAQLERKRLEAHQRDREVQLPDGGGGAAGRSGQTVGGARDGGDGEET